jgi:hypothetical protein
METRLSRGHRNRAGRWLAALRGNGLDYFLEVALALEAANVGNTGSRFERVIYYAENDAYLF